MDKVRKSLEEIIENVLDIKFGEETIPFLDSLKQEDFGEWDSMAQIIILSQIEKEFQVQFSIDEMIGLSSVGALIKAIESHKKG